MFAILISSETLPKITEEVELCEDDVNFLRTCFGKNRYFVRGAILNGRMLPWSILIHYNLVRQYQYDATKIRTDWDQIVRK